MEKTLKRMRKTIIELIYLAKEGHIASSYSVLEIIYSLYISGQISNINGRDGYFILSKGHAVLALYVVLNEFGIITKNDLYSYCQHDSIYAGHPNHKIPGITFSTGSLGHGINYAIGMCLALKALGKNNKVFCLVGDGEINEGTIWESMLIAEQNKLTNLIMIIDNNNSTKRCLTVHDKKRKIESFGFHVMKCNGNNIYEMLGVLSELPKDRTCAIIADTIKGYGIKQIENSYEWHHKIPNDSEYKQLINQLKI